MAPIIALVILTSALTGCVAEDWKAQAQSVAEGYLQALKAKELERAIAFFSPHYLETRSYEALRTDAQVILASLGEPRDYRLTAARRRRDFIPPDTGTLVTLEYEVRYAKGAARETFTLLKPFGRGEYRIVGHRIASEGPPVK